VTIVGPVPDVLVTHNGAEITIPDDAMAFVATRNRSHAPMLGASDMKHYLNRARAADAPVFAIGRFIVYVFNQAWRSVALAQELETTLVDAQHRRIPGAIYVT